MRTCWAPSKPCRASAPSRSSPAPPPATCLVEDDASIARVLRSGRRRVAFHSEDEYRLRERKPLFKSGDPYSDHAVWRDVECAFLGTRRIVALARETGRPIHILHVSTAEELAFLADHRDLASVEVLLNHLVQSAPDVYDRLGPLWCDEPADPRRPAPGSGPGAAVADGTVDTIGSDHAPAFPAPPRRSPGRTAAAGLTGVQTLLPMLLNEVAAGKLSLLRLADLTAAGPAPDLRRRQQGPHRGRP